MKKNLLLTLIVLLFPLMVFAGDISATATGSNQEEAEQNAYVELSKFINISVYDEQKLETYSDRDSTDNSNYSSKAIQTTANNFIKTEKSFKTEGDIVTCTVTLLESSAPNYISLMSDYVTTLKSLESSYENGKESLSFELKKTTITNILEEYRKYDNAKSILLAMDKFNSDIIKPAKTSSIWNNEYQNLIIQHNNELLQKMNSLDTTSTDKLIQDQIDSINEEIAKSKYELKQAEIIKESSMNQMIEQRQKEIDSSIDEIMARIINDNAISAEILSQSIDIKQLLENFASYYDQYISVGKEYDGLIQAQKDLNEKELNEGVEEIENREYQLSDMNAFGTPGAVAKAIRDSEVRTFKANKTAELKDNIEIIDNQFTPILNKLQASMFSILSTIDNKEEFLLTLNPTDIECEIDADDGCFYCTIKGEDSYLPIDGLELKIPLASLDERMDFNINDRHFDANDKSQVQAYNDYTETVELYKELMKKNQFLSYQFKLKIKASTVLNRFTNDNTYNAKIVTEIDDLQIVRNDVPNKVLDGANAVYGVDSRITKLYEDFFDANIPFIESYYSPNALDFYNTKLGKKSTTSSSSSSSDTTSNYTPRTNTSGNTGFNELGDAYYKETGYHGPDEITPFITIGLGGIGFSTGDAAELSSYYTSSESIGGITPILFQGSLNLSAFIPTKTSIYLAASFVYRSFNYKVNSLSPITTYSDGSFGLKAGANIVLYNANPWFLSVIPYVGANFGDQTSYNAGAMIAASSPDSNLGFAGLGGEYILTGDLANRVSVYIELGY
jgi:hypothetical protein